MEENSTVVTSYVGWPVRLCVDFETRFSRTKDDNQRVVIPRGTVGTIRRDTHLVSTMPPYEAVTVEFEATAERPRIWAFLRADELEDAR